MRVQPPGDRAVPAASWYFGAWTLRRGDSMSSFGESELLVISRIVGRIRVLDLDQGSALFPRIIVRLGVTLHDNPKNEFTPGRPIEAFELRDVRGEVRLEEHAKVVGSLLWAGPPRFVRSSSYGAEN